MSFGLSFVPKGLFANASGPKTVQRSSTSEQSPGMMTRRPVTSIAQLDASGINDINPEALWFAENVGMPNIAVSSSPGGVAVGRGLGRGMGISGRVGGNSLVPTRPEQLRSNQAVESRQEHERLREQREQEQLEAAIRISQEMAEQEDARHHAAARAAAASTALREERSSANANAFETTPVGQNLFAGLSFSSARLPAHVSHPSINTQGAANSAFSFLQEDAPRSQQCGENEKGMHELAMQAEGAFAGRYESYREQHLQPLQLPDSARPLEPSSGSSNNSGAGQTSVFSFLQSPNAFPHADRGISQEVGELPKQTTESKQIIESTDDAREPLSLVLVLMNIVKSIRELHKTTRTNTFSFWLMMYRQQPARICSHAE